MTKNTKPNKIFGRRLREARLRMGIAQDKLGVAVGLDESCSSARMSRYETGIHEPPIAIVEKIADILCVPIPYFFCTDDRLASIIIDYQRLSEDQKTQLISWIQASAIVEK
ncbi:helix-turn-helix transcriptional regulator [Methylomonas sp. AM2-LC]|uniref:helix-turn-helix domain-containing protein n=1 Tax=Methylomonas sp. AM2-LC TaxID=3153301 RepID=UPI0032657752